MNISNKLKQRFCKDVGVSISVYEEPYFSERIELYDVKEKWDLFLETLKDFNNEQEYFAFYNNLKDDIINHIKEKSAYKKFNNQDMQQYFKKNYNIKSKSIYKPTNIGKILVSIDMKKANFTCLRYFDSSIFNEHLSWEEFLSDFTDNKHIISSKYIRQVIFGNLNPKRQVTYQKYMMSIILDELLKSIPIDDIEFYSNDELVLVNNNYTINIVKNICNSMKFNLRIEEFLLGYSKEFDCYLKVGNNNKREVKCITGLMMPLYMRLAKGEEIKDSDLVFKYEKRLVKLLDYPKELLVDIWKKN